jgi:hypothetical protein
LGASRARSPAPKTELCERTRSFSRPTKEKKKNTLSPMIPRWGIALAAGLLWRLVKRDRRQKVPFTGRK